MSGPGMVPAWDKMPLVLRPELLPKCDVCGLVYTNGRGQPWPSCACELNDQIVGESPEDP